MKDIIYKAILEYKKAFSTVEDLSSYYKLEDLRLPDMRAHNTIIIKPGISIEETRDIISKNLELRKAQGSDFLTVTSYDQLSLNDVSFSHIQPELELYDLMTANTTSYSSLNFKEKAKVELAVYDQVIQDGRMVDIEANKEAMTEAFAIKRIDRKIEIYKDKTRPLNLYVIYLNGEPAGNCELFLGEDIAQIEDFDILPRFQKMGMGTHFLKELLSIAQSNGYKSAFVITDHLDTAKIMYEKRGFTYVGIITELLYNLS